MYLFIYKYRKYMCGIFTLIYHFKYEQLSKSQDSYTMTQNCVTGVLSLPHGNYWAISKRSYDTIIDRIIVAVLSLQRKKILV